MEKTKESNSAENVLLSHHERCIYLLLLIKKCNERINSHRNSIEIEEAKSNLHAYLITPKSYYMTNINNLLHVRRRLWDWHTERQSRINKILEL